jgi:hypothetical protein
MHFSETGAFLTSGFAHDRLAKAHPRVMKPPVIRQILLGLLLVSLPTVLRGFGSLQYLHRPAEGNVFDGLHGSNHNQQGQIYSTMHPTSTTNVHSFTNFDVRARALKHS